VPKFFLFLVALLWTGFVSYFCLVNSSEIPTMNIPNLDKCVHTFFHLVFTLVWFMFFNKQIQINTIFKPLLYSVVFSFVFGITIEILQSLITTTRSADVFDVIANTIGSLAAILVIVICNKLNVLNSILKK
jgi:VanZ family protein